MKMSVAEIAELAGCSKSTICGRIRNIMPEESGGPGRKTMLSEDKAYIIIASVTGKEYMTPGEIADVAGCHIKTVYRVANNLYPDSRGGKGHALKYDKSQCHVIMGSLPTKNDVDGITERTNGTTVAPSPAPSDIGALAKTMEVFMTKIIEIISPIHQTPIRSEVEAPATVPQLPSPAPEVSSRDRINKIVRGYCQEKRIPFKDGYNRIYLEHKYACNKDLKLKAKNRDIKTMDMFELEGEIQNLLAIAIKIYGE